MTVFSWQLYASFFFFECDLSSCYRTNSLCIISFDVIPFKVNIETSYYCCFLFFPNILISSIIMSKKYISNYTVCNLNNDCICQQPQVTKVFIVDMRYAIRCWPILSKLSGLLPNPWCNIHCLWISHYIFVEL